MDNNEIYEAYRQLAAEILVYEINDYRAIYRDWLKGKITNKQYLNHIKSIESYFEWHNFLMSYVGDNDIETAIREAQRTERKHAKKNRA